MGTTTQARRGTSHGRSRPGEDYYTDQERNKPGQEQARTLSLSRVIEVNGIGTSKPLPKKLKTCFETFPNPISKFPF